MKILAFALYIIFSTAQNACSPYKCVTTNMNVNKDTCFYFNHTDEAYWIQPCPNATVYCPVSYNENSPIQCEAAVKPTKQAWPGEKCTNNDNCLPGSTCNGNICVGKTVGEACTDNSDCNPQLYCGANKQCQQQILAGKTGCTNDFMCVNSALCNYTSGQDPSKARCLNAYSLLPGTIIADCPVSGINPLCIAELCIQNNGISYCGDKVVSVNSIPITCNSYVDCMSLTDRFVGGYYYSNCSCGYNADASAYCELFPGDQPYSRYLTLKQIWLSSQEVNLCNTERRDIGPCMQNYFADYVELAYQYLYVSIYPKIQANTDCVKEVMNTNFWGLWQKIVDQDETSSSLLRIISLIALYFI